MYLAAIIFNINHNYQIIVQINLQIEQKSCLTSLKSNYEL